MRSNRVGPMHGRKVPERVLALDLHYVDLAAGRPSNLTDVRAKRPERRPDSASLRRLDTGLNPGVDAERVFAAGIHSRRRELTPAKIFSSLRSPAFHFRSARSPCD